MDILFLRPETSDDDPDAKEMDRMGAKILRFSTARTRVLDLADLLPHVRADLLWCVPGGTYFYSSIVLHDLQRVLRHFRESSKRAFYTDNADSVIYRVSALRAIRANGADLSANSRDMARMLQAAKYDFFLDSDPERVLCRLEKDFGGADSSFGKGAY